jgi:hypothetical protein
MALNKALSIRHPKWLSIRHPKWLSTRHPKWLSIRHPKWLSIGTRKWLVSLTLSMLTVAAVMVAKVTSLLLLHRTTHIHMTDHMTICYGHTSSWQQLEIRPRLYLPTAAKIPDKLAHKVHTKVNAEAALAGLDQCALWSILHL